MPRADMAQLLTLFLEVLFGQNGVILHFWKTTGSLGVNALAVVRSFGLGTLRHRNICLPI